MYPTQKLMQLVHEMLLGIVSNDCLVLLIRYGEDKPLPFQWNPMGPYFRKGAICTVVNGKRVFFKPFELFHGLHIHMKFGNLATKVSNRLS